MKKIDRVTRLAEEGDASALDDLCSSARRGRVPWPHVCRAVALAVSGVADNPYRTVQLVVRLIRAGVPYRLLLAGASKKPTADEAVTTPSVDASRWVHLPPSAKVTVRGVSVGCCTPHPTPSPMPSRSPETISYWPSRPAVAFVGCCTPYPPEMLLTSCLMRSPETISYWPASTGVAFAGCADPNGVAWVSCDAIASHLAVVLTVTPILRPIIERTFGEQPMLRRLARLRLVSLMNGTRPRRRMAELSSACYGRIPAASEGAAARAATLYRWLLPLLSTDHRPALGNVVAFGHTVPAGYLEYIRRCGRRQEAVALASKWNADLTSNLLEYMSSPEAWLTLNKKRRLRLKDVKMPMLPRVTLEEGAEEGVRATLLSAWSAPLGARPLPSTTGDSDGQATSEEDQSRTDTHD